MYKLSVPIMSSTVNEGNREKYVELCRNAGAERIFVCNGSVMEVAPKSLRDNVAYFKSRGFEVGIWTDTIGHGSVLDHVENRGDAPRFSQMVDIMGEERSHANCPFDANFKKYISEYIADLATTGVDIVMLDDDFRMSQHGTELCCGCPAHLRRMSEILGEDVTLEQIRPYVLSGKSNRYRDAWLKAQNDGLTKMALAIRAEVDKKNPEVTVCNCTASAPWNVDGTDVVGIAKILAGKNKPILRLTGAPYWAVSRNRKFSLVTVIELARMLASFVEGEGIELMSEGDVYPRPRYTCPASYLELFDAATRTDGGYDGILKYMFDYVAGPDLEMGYLKMHGEALPTLEKIHEFFPKGANEGVRVITYPHTFGDSDLDLSSLSNLSPLPLDGTMFGSCGIPTIYRGEGMCSSVFGENARRVELSKIKGGAVLDAVSAILLSERGVDVGLCSHGNLSDKNISFICTKDKEYKSFINNGKVRMLDAELDTRATPVLFSTSSTGKEVLAYTYENGDGDRFLVFLFEGASMCDSARACYSGVVKNYAVQRALADTLPWVARVPIPAVCVGNPELYLTCEREGDSLSVGLFNCFADPILEPKITLGEGYGKIECVGCEAKLCGREVTLTSKLYGFSYAAFRVFK